MEQLRSSSAEKTHSFFIFILGQKSNNAAQYLPAAKLLVSSERLNAMNDCRALGFADRGFGRFAGTRGGR